MLTWHSNRFVAPGSTHIGCFGKKYENSEFRGFSVQAGTMELFEILFAGL